jgi:hypothetical protein
VKKGALTEDAKDFATMCFAKYMRLTQVIAAVEERFGVTVDKRVMQGYDPETVKGSQMSKKRRALFAAVREKFLEELDEIPIASRAVRLQQLQVHYDKAISSKTPNVRMALEILERAAKEAGGVHTNEHKVHHTGKVAAVVEPVTEDEMRNSLAAAIATAMQEERDKLQGVTKH